MAENTALKTLRKDLKAREKVASGTVVRFTVEGRYTYAALYVNGAWYLTGTVGYLPRKMTYADFMDVLANEERVTGAALATAWDTI